MAMIEGFLDKMSGFVWGWGTVGLILFVGLYLSVRTRFVQLRRIGRAIRYTFGKGDGGAGEVSPLGALCASLAATIGTGNIVGVATAVAVGGPGALLWMLTAAFLGMATKYAEGMLAVKYREKTGDGKCSGGPFRYIEKGLGKQWTPLAKAFALSGAAAGLLGVGTITQISGITAAVGGFFDPENRFAAVTIGGRSYSLAAVIAGAVVAGCAALVLLGGIKRIAAAAEVIVPVMAGVYVVCSMLILAVRLDRIPAAASLICRSAFDPAAVGGAIGGLTLKTVIQKGVGRGIFSNEAGLGSAPIAAACAKTDDPCRQGLVTMTATLIDTGIICTMTGLSIVVTGAWDLRVTGARLDGVDVTAYAWRVGLPFGERTAAFLLMSCLCLFAFTTIIGWSFYGERCTEYLCRGDRRASAVYRALYILALIIGPYLSVKAVWDLADVCNGMMALPNLVALFLLAGDVAGGTD